MPRRRRRSEVESEVESVLKCEKKCVFFFFSGSWWPSAVPGASVTRKFTFFRRMHGREDVFPSFSRRFRITWCPTSSLLI